MNLLATVLDISCVMTLVTLASYITFRIAGFPDLSVDGVFTLGAVVFATCVTAGMDGVSAFFLAALAGALAGLATTAISHYFKIHPLLASVLMLIMLQTINLRILGKPNQPLLRMAGGIFDSPQLYLGMVALAAVLALLFLFVFFVTELGSAMRITGSCPAFLASIGKNPAYYRMTLVTVAGILVALAGSFLAIKYRYADVYFGNGMVVFAIASLVAGEKLFGRNTLVKQIAAVPCGTFFYQLIVAVVLAAGLSPMDMKLATALLIIVLLGFGSGKEDDLLAGIR
jgi:putative ABC transport system permease protein